MIIRNEEAKDYRAVEEITKKAFWNVNSPGCVEHYLVHVLRKHSDFIPELDFVIEEDGQIVGNVVYMKAKLVSPDGAVKHILSFGPLAILPAYQRKGYGKKLLEYSFEKAKQIGYDAIVIFGNPENYISRGFVCGKKFGIGIGDDIYPVALLVKELVPGAFGKDKKWVFKESSAYEIEEKDAEVFDKDFEQMEKAYSLSQELFYIYSHSIVKW